MSDTLVYIFSSPTCGPCQTIKPSIADLKEEFENVTWREVNTKQDINGAAAAFSISVVPTIVVTRGSASVWSPSTEREIGRYSGTQMSIWYTLVRRGLV